MKHKGILLLLICAALPIVAVILNRKADTAAFAERPPQPVDGKAVPVLVELFTSQGCSSCPPADEVLARLEQTQPVAGVEVIALSEHVDYWNRLGWADPFSSPIFSERQGRYADAFGKDGVYTPQMVVDGRTEFVGSNMSRARDAIARAAKFPKATIHLARNDGAQGDVIPLTVQIEDLPETSGGDTVEVLLAVTESGLRTDVPRGENAGRKLSHTAVVRRLEVIGSIKGASFAAAPVVRMEKGWRHDRLRAIVFTQERASRRVVGAATVALHPRA